MRIRRATRIARSSSALWTAPDSPYLEWLAIRTASSSSSNGITARTGPKTSSWAISLSGATCARRVGS